MNYDIIAILILSYYMPMIQRHEKNVLLTNHFCMSILLKLIF